MSSSTCSGRLDAGTCRQDVGCPLGRRVVVSAAVPAAHPHLLLPPRPTSRRRQTAARLARLQHPAVVDGADEVRGAGVDSAAVCGADVCNDGAVRVDSSDSATALDCASIVHQRQS